MLSTSRHNHEVSSFDILVFTGNGGFAYSRGKSQGLIDSVDLWETSVSFWTGGAEDHPSQASRKARTDLISDIPTDRHSHEHDLRVETRPKHSPEFARLGGQSRGHVGEVDHLMFGGSGRHVGVFGKADC